jgi:hypothetical protein
MQPPRYETGSEWAQHLVKAACKSCTGSFVAALHADESLLSLPPMRPIQPNSQVSNQNVACRTLSSVRNIINADSKLQTHDLPGIFYTIKL